MTNDEILRIALEQSAADANCSAEDLLASENKIVYSVPRPDARRYLDLPLPCHLISYGCNIVASISPGYEEIVRDYINRYPVEHCFETPNLHVPDDAFSPFGIRSCFMAEYWLPDVDRLAPLPCNYRTAMFGPNDFSALYLPEWSNALCERRKELDVLGIGAYDGEKLIALAACSADCETMWQIGVDVLPEYRRQGIASALTSRLALEILTRGKVPFYCCAWSNIRSARNAVRSGFRPAWVELTFKSRTFVDGLNGTPIEKSGG